MIDSMKNPELNKLTEAGNFASLHYAYNYRFQTNCIMNQTSFGNLVRFDPLPLLNSEERFTA